MNISNRTLFIADNLDIMRGIDSECIDLIYLDPPFNKKKHFKAPIGGASFKDIWTDEDVKREWHGEIAETHEELYQIIQASEVIYDKSMKIYLMAMAVRLFEMHRILKPTGSIYLHCDPTASHYLKLIMDSLFEKQNFKNEIIWSYRTGGVSKNHFPRKHDTLIFYVKSQEYQHTALQERIFYEKSFFTTKVDKETGRYYADVYIRDVWDDIKPLINVSKERKNFPTQKPLALLRRILSASSDVDDIILDPFCGCATACVAAEQLNRQWIGIDIAKKSETITIERLQEEVDKGSDLWNPLEDITVSNTPPSELTTFKQLCKDGFRVPKPISINFTDNKRANVQDVITSYPLGI